MKTLQKYEALPSPNPAWPELWAIENGFALTDPCNDKLHEQQTFSDSKLQEQRQTLANNRTND